MAELADDENSASVVVFRSGEDGESLLEGFTIAGGRGTLESLPPGLFGSAGDLFRLGGGVLCVADSSPRLVNCVVTENRAEAGGGVFCSDLASPTIQGCTIRQNVTPGATLNLGAGLFCHRNAAPIVTDCRITENAALGTAPSSEGGGVFFWNCSPTMNECTISHNSAAVGGGAQFWGDVYCGAMLTGCAIEANVSREGQGGGVCCYSYAISPTLENCRIVGNCTFGSAGGQWGSQGGGVFFGGGEGIPCRPELTNCVIAGNWGEVSGGGGGVHCYRAMPVLTNCTITRNLCPGNGGIFCFESTPLLTNCIVWENIPESICGEASHCLTGEDPLFVDGGEFDFSRLPEIRIGGAWYLFPDFIVREPDYHLLPDSPAIDAGTPAGAPPADTAGNCRLCGECGENVDIGAYEYCVSGPLFVRGDPNADSKHNISDAVVILSYLFTGGDRPTCLDAADTDDNGSLELTDAVYLLGFLFLGGPAPQAPFPECGVDPTADELTCESYSPCQL
jgi:hypothetical protein